MSSTQVHFCFPVKRLENDCVILEPFVLEQHAAPYIEGCKDHPALFAYLPYGPYTSIADFENSYRNHLESNDTVTLFAVMAKSAPSDEFGTVAGVISLRNASPNNATVEIGSLTILPPFQRTAVTNNAVGLLLAYTLDQPPAGLGLRRSQWQSHSANERSIRVAKRMGYTFEGIQRFHMTIPSNKEGNGADLSCVPDAYGLKLGQARDTAFFAHYCDEWQEKKLEVLKAMEPRS